MKLSVRQLFFAITAALLLLVFVVPYIKRDYNFAMTNLRTTLSDPKTRLSHSLLVDAIGYEPALNLLEDCFETNEYFEIDDAGRLALIQQEVMTDGVGCSDVVWLSNLGSNKYYRWHGPDGLRLHNIEISSRGARMDAFGNLKLNGSVESITRDHAFELVAEWPASEEPAQGSFFKQIWIQLHPAPVAVNVE